MKLTLTISFFVFTLLNIAEAHQLQQGELGFITGFAHPFIGVDHLLLLTALGASLTLVRRLFMLGLVFITVLIHGHIHIQQLLVHDVTIQIWYPFGMFLSSALIVYCVQRFTKLITIIWHQRSIK